MTCWFTATFELEEDPRRFISFFLFHPLRSCLFFFKPRYQNDLNIHFARYGLASVETLNSPPQPPPLFPPPQPSSLLYVNASAAVNASAVNASAAVKASAPPPPPGAVAVISTNATASVIQEQEVAAAALAEDPVDCSTRPVTVTEWSIVVDLVVMLMLAYFIRRAKIKAMSEKSRVAWMKGLVGALGGKGRTLPVLEPEREPVKEGGLRNRLLHRNAANGSFQRQSVQAEKVSNEIARRNAKEKMEARQNSHGRGAKGRDVKPNNGEKRSVDDAKSTTNHHAVAIDAASEGDDTRDRRKKGFSAFSPPPRPVDGHLGVVLRAARVKWGSKTHEKDSAGTFDDDEEIAAAESEAFSSLGSFGFLSTPEEAEKQKQVQLERVRAGRMLTSKLKTAAEAAGTAAVNFLATFFIPLIILVTCLSALARVGADLISIGKVFFRFFFNS